MNASTMLLSLALAVLVVAAFAVPLAASCVIRAVFLRNVKSYFTGVLGYVFIVVYVLSVGIFAFRPQFFSANQLTLDQLSEWYALLLLFIVPAITMTAWSDERKLGTDEILFTLPARDWEILAGKYLATVAVYTAALAFSFPLLFWLGWLGDPDWGLIFSTYFGYWLAGAALLAIGMFASVLTSSATVAYTVGVALCAIPVVIGMINPASQFLQGFSLPARMRDFETGVVPMSGVLYFVSLAAIALYLNLIFISRRHWSAKQQAAMELQFVLRAVSVLAVLASLNVIAAQASPRVDLTHERLFSLSSTTSDVVSKADAEHPVLITAFATPEVPKEYIPVRKQLLGLLREYDRLGSGIEVRYVDVEPFSPESEEAKNSGIEAKRVTTEHDGRSTEETFFLGAVVSSSNDEVVIPLFTPGTPIEYELTRSIRTVAKEKRLTVGILNTDAQLLSASNEWKIVTELKKQYKVEEVSADAPIDETKYDVVIAVLPSSLTARQLPNLVEYVKKGHPTLIFDDPFPLVFSSPFGTSNAPRQSKPKPGGMFGGMGGPPPEPKADDGRLTPLLQQLGLLWDNGQVVWQRFNPHKRYEVVPPEYLFITPQSGLSDAINQKADVTRDLQEILMFYAGTLVQDPRRDPDLILTPLLRTNRDSGLLDWDDYSRDGFDMQRMQPVRQRVPDPPRLTKWRVMDFTDLKATNKARLEKQPDGSIFVTGEEGKVTYQLKTEMRFRGVTRLRLETLPDDRLPKGGPGRAKDGNFVVSEIEVFVAPKQKPEEKKKVRLFNAKAPYSAPKFEVAAAIDGVTDGAGGWSIGSEGGEEHEAIFEIQDLTSEDGEMIVQIDIHQNYPDGEKSVGKFRLSSTNDPAHVLGYYVTSKSGKKGVNAIVVPDIDCISDIFFSLREQDDEQLKFDNIPFVLNAVDVLAGDTSYLALRTRRPELRTLKKFEERTREYEKNRTEREEQAAKDAKRAIDQAKARFKKQLDAIQKDTTLDDQTKETMIEQVQDTEERRIKVEEAHIEREKQEKIDKIKAEREDNIRRERTRIQWLAWLTLPIPAIVLGAGVLLSRMSGERSRIKSSRLVK